jgi:hypothetical protein
MTENEITIDLDKATNTFLAKIKEGTDVTEENLNDFKNMFQTACTDSICEIITEDEDNDDNIKEKKNGKKLSGYNIYMSKALSKKDKGGQQLQMKDAINNWNKMSEEEQNKWKILATEHNKKNNMNNNNKKKKLSGYNLFMQKKMKKIDKGGEAIPMSEAIKQWQNLTEDEKKVWNDKAKNL